jgi:hypothetical protein
MHGDKSVGIMQELSIATAVGSGGTIEVSAGAPKLYGPSAL